VPSHGFRQLTLKYHLCSDFTTVPLIPCEKLTGRATTTHGLLCPAVVSGSGRADHLTKQAKDIPRNDQADVKQIGASCVSAFS
ncbi:hypothetical protein SESBI_45130, partial [Sesbania bispinosa]